MFKVLLLTSIVVLAGCVSQQSTDALNADNAACRAGYRDACEAAVAQYNANQVEYQNNAAIGIGLLGAVLEGAAAGAAAGATTPVYIVPVRHFH